MASLKDLYDLCHSMDKAEKRFTSIFIKGLAGKSKDNYLLQLDNIYQVKPFEETALKNKMENISTKRISEFNSNLFDYISKGLVLYYSDKSDSLHLGKEAMLAEIYMSKGMLSTADKLIQKAIEKETGYNNNEMLVHFQKLQYKVGLKQFATFDDQIVLLDEKLKQLEIVKSETAYQKLNFEMNKLFATITLPRTKEQALVYEEFLKRELLQTDALAKSNYAQHYYYMIKIPLLNVVHKDDEALALSEEAIYFTRNNFDLKKDPIPLFFAA